MLGFGGEQIGQPLGFGQIHATILKSAPREFAWPGSTKSRHSRQRARYSGNRSAPAVQVEFDEIFAGYGIGTGKTKNQSRIKNLTLPA